MVAELTRDRKALVAMKRQEPDTFYADDAELQEADQDTLREITHGLEDDDEREDAGRY